MFRFNHNSLAVLDVDRSLKFYAEALNLREVSRRDYGDLKLILLSDSCDSTHKLELRWLAEHKPYDLGDNEVHIAFTTKNFDAAHEKHKAMGCICFENAELGIYFIEDPDGYRIEIMRE